MRTRATGAVPAGLQGMQRRFEAWRRNRRGRSQIPKGLWAAAAKAAATHGLCRTARTLGLNYTALKRYVAVGGSGGSAPSNGRADRQPCGDDWGGGAHDQTGLTGAAFVELPAMASGGGCECLLEWEDPGGARMRVHLKEALPGHLAALGRSFGIAGS